MIKTTSSELRLCTHIVRPIWNIVYVQIAMCRAPAGKDVIFNWMKLLIYRAKATFINRCDFRIVLLFVRKPVNELKWKSDEIIEKCYLRQNIGKSKNGLVYNGDGELLVVGDKP